MFHLLLYNCTCTQLKSQTPNVNRKVNPTLLVPALVFVHRYHNGIGHLFTSESLFWFYCYIQVDIDRPNGAYSSMDVDA